jgi:hypothetical protein
MIGRSAANKTGAAAWGATPAPTKGGHMSSSSSGFHLTLEDIHKLERVLERAGYPASQSESDGQRLHAAANFLIREFQNGNFSETVLLDALNRKFGTLLRGDEIGQNPAAAPATGRFKLYLVQ